MNRRQFIATAASAVASVPAAAQESVQPVAAPFPLHDVRLLDGPWTNLVERNRAYLHALESDRLLHTFRLTAALPSSAEPLGGWEAPGVELRGHFLGHYLSACAMMSVSARDEALKSKAADIVVELAKCQKANGGGYLSAVPAAFFERLKTTGKVWAPWYTIHKILAGLFDQYTFAGNQQALDVLQSMAAWTANWADPINDQDMQTILKVEFGGMAEVLNNLYAVTGDPRHAQLAGRFEKRTFLDPLAERRDVLKGLHANTHIPQAIAAARKYELTGDQRYRTIAEYFWTQVTGHHSYCTGGNSNREAFGAPDQLASQLSATTEECCCTYNMLKLTRHVFSWNAGPAQADYYERALFNGIIGTMNPEDGMTMYYVPLASGYWKMFGLPRQSFWCCTGTGTENFSKLQDSIYFHNGRTLYVNLFVPSTLDWREKNVTLRQETGFPDEDTSQLTVTAAHPSDMDIRIRIPYWTRGAIVKVNGKPVPDTPEAGKYLSIQRTWKTGDKVQIKLPMSLHTSAMPDDASLQAFLYGPLVLAGRLGSEGLTGEAQSSDRTQQVKSHYVRGNPVAVPDLHAPTPKPAPHPLTFEIAAQPSDITLIPLNRLFGERYAVYWRVQS
jgi:DUF1680 family protein